jgi:hypothetical protein
LFSVTVLFRAVESVPVTVSVEPLTETLRPVKVKFANPKCAHGSGVNG